MPAPAFCELRIMASSPATRVSGGGTDEARVDDLQVLLFDENCALETSGRSAGASVSLSCRSGDKTVWAFVNAPTLSGIVRLSDLSAVVSRLSDNAPGRLVMGGNRPLTVRGNGTDIGVLCDDVNPEGATVLESVMHAAGFQMIRIVRK